MPEHANGPHANVEAAEALPGSLQAIEAADVVEVAVLGAMILDHGCRDELAAMDTCGLFGRPAHQTLADLIVGMHRQGRHVDEVTTLDRACELDVIDELGGPAALSAVTSPAACPSPASWRHYLTIVAEHAARRRRIAELRAELAELEGVR
jgi:replicative DNA helicase